MKTLLTILLIGYSTFSFTQSDVLKDRFANLELGVNTKYKLYTFDIGVNFDKIFMNETRILVNTDAIIFSSEFGMKNNSFLYVPKITYSYNYILLNGSISLLNYNYSDNHSVYIKPQIGGTFFGLIDLVYGYNIPLSNRNQEFQGSTLTLRIKLMETVKTFHLFSK